jgi:hypothetical protein
MRRNLIICNIQYKLLGKPYQERYDGQDMLIFSRDKKCFQNFSGKNLGDLRVDERVVTYNKGNILQQLYYDVYRINLAQ